MKNVFELRASNVFPSSEAVPTANGLPKAPDPVLALRKHRFRFREVDFTVGENGASSFDQSQNNLASPSKSPVGFAFLSKPNHGILIEINDVHR